MAAPLAIERIAADPEAPCGIAHVAARRADGVLDGGVGQQAQVVGLRRGVRQVRRVAISPQFFGKVFGQIAKPDRIALVGQERARGLDRIGKLAQIARPVIAAEGLHQLGLQNQFPTRCGLLQQLRNQGREIFALVQ